MRPNPTSPIRRRRRDETLAPLSIQGRGHAPRPSRNAKMGGGKYPTSLPAWNTTRWGHPTASPKLHTEMTAKPPRQTQAASCASKFPRPEFSGDKSGDVAPRQLWGSDHWGPVQAKPPTRLPTHRCQKVSSLMHLRHLHPAPPRARRHFQPLQENRRRGTQRRRPLRATASSRSLLRAKLCQPPHPQHLQKPTASAYKVREIVAGIEQTHRKHRSLNPNAGAARSSALTPQL